MSLCKQVNCIHKLYIIIESFLLWVSERGVWGELAHRGISPQKEQGEALRTTRKIDELGMNGNDGLEIH